MDPEPPICGQARRVDGTDRVPNGMRYPTAGFAKRDVCDDEPLKVGSSPRRAVIRYSFEFPFWHRVSVVKWASPKLIQGIRRASEKRTDYDKCPKLDIKGGGQGALELFQRPQRNKTNLILHKADGDAGGYSEHERMDRSPPRGRAP